MVAWTLVAHIFGIVLWIGGLSTTAVLLSQHVRQTSPEARAALTRLEKKSMRAMADPGALIAILAGIGLIFSNRVYYLHAVWLHIKLSLVVLLIIVHAFVGIEMKSVQKGVSRMGSGRAWLWFTAVLLIFIAILIVTLPGQVYLRH